MLFGPWNIKWEILKHWSSTLFSILKCFVLFCSVLFQTPPEKMWSLPSMTSNLAQCISINKQFVLIFRERWPSKFVIGSNRVYAWLQKTCAHKKLVIGIVGQWTGACLINYYIRQNVQYTTEHIVVGPLFILLDPLFIHIGKRDDFLSTKSQIAIIVSEITYNNKSAMWGQSTTVWNICCCLLQQNTVYTIYF